MGRKRRIPSEINAGSMADIAFLLLIFFLVTTTMDIDSGLTRKLPPWLNEDQPPPPPIKERNVLVVLVNAQNQLMVEGEAMDITQLKEKAKKFIKSDPNNPELPEFKYIEIPFFGKYPVSKQVISLQNDRGTSYDMYIQVQNELVAAYNELRDELAMQKFGKPFSKLSKEKQKAIQKIYPQRISEAEPKNIGGL